MMVIHEADSDGIHTVSDMAEAERYTVHTEADHQGNPDIRSKTYLLLPQATGTRRNHDRRMQRAAIQTEWGGSEDERVDQILRALSDPGAKELILAYEADRQDTTALQTYRMDCLHRAPLRKLARYVRGVYQFDKFPVRKWSPEQETLVDHLQPKPIMVLHLDNTIKMGHEPHTKPTHSRRAHQYRWDWRTAQIHCNQKQAKTTVVVECPPETSIRTRDAFMKRINGHQSDVASTIASKDPHNTFRWKCASEHTAGQSGSHAWRLHLPMQLLPRLTRALQTIKQEEENAGNPGPYWLTETDYESLYILRQQYTEHKEDRISSVHRKEHRILPQGFPTSRLLPSTNTVSPRRRPTLDCPTTEGHEKLRTGPRNDQHHTQPQQPDTVNKLLQGHQTAAQTNQKRRHNGVRRVDTGRRRRHRKSRGILLWMLEQLETRTQHVE